MRDDRYDLLICVAAFIGLALGIALGLALVA